MSWNELTISWNEMTFLWNEITFLWNDLPMEPNDRIPSYDLSARQLAQSLNVVYLSFSRALGSVRYSSSVDMFGLVLWKCSPSLLLKFIV